MDVPPDVWRAAVKARVFAKADGVDLPAISAVYHDLITSILTGYFESGSITAPRNEFKRAMVEAFGAAFDLGWLDGGQELPPDEDALSWFNARVEAEFGHIEELFIQAKELRKEDEFDFFSWLTSKADSYTRSLSGVYNAALMLAKKNQMLTWRLGNTEVHCSTCAKLDGGKHRASWYISRDYIPRKAGASMDCGGYNCDCRLEDKEGNEVTV
jgi:hypothetical protein